MGYRKRGQIIWRAVSVWMLYGSRTQPTPGIYRPGGWLSSVRVRQGSVAALHFLNVLMLHLGMPPEMALLECMRRPSVPAADHTPERISLIWYVLMTLAPLLLPIHLLPLFIGREVQSIHDQIETAEPLDLYPSAHPGDRR